MVLNCTMQQNLQKLGNVTSHCGPTTLGVEGSGKAPHLRGLHHHIRGSLEGAHLVLISARSRTTAITGADPSPVAGSEV